MTANSKCSVSQRLFGVKYPFIVVKCFISERFTFFSWLLLSLLSNESQVTKIYVQDNFEKEVPLLISTKLFKHQISFQLSSLKYKLTERIFKIAPRSSWLTNFFILIICLYDNVGRSFTWITSRLTLLDGTSWNSLNCVPFHRKIRELSACQRATAKKWTPSTDRALTP